MKRLGVVSALVVIWPLLLVPGGARAAGGLTADEQAMLTELLGQGVIGAPVAWAGIRGQTIIQLSVNDYVLETLMTSTLMRPISSPNPTTRKMACRSWSTWYGPK